MTQSPHAAFLSYASQDAEAAQRICETLRATGIFLDQSELRSADAWDKKIRHEIHDCALFISMIRHSTLRSGSRAIFGLVSLIRHCTVSRNLEPIEWLE